jgi:hypothetical protein
VSNLPIFAIEKKAQKRRMFNQNTISDHVSDISLPQWDLFEVEPGGRLLLGHWGIAFRRH